MQFFDNIIRVEDVFEGASEVPVVHNRALGHVGEVMVEHVKLHRGEDERRQEGEWVPLPEAVKFRKFLSNVLVHFNRPLEIVVEIDPRVHELRRNPIARS